MKKLTILSGALLLSLSAFTATAQQLPNVGFDSWKSTCGASISVPNSTASRPGVEPTDWNGSNVNQMGVKKSTLVTKTTDSENTVVQLKNIYVGLSLLKIGSVAPGFITFGTPWVYATRTVSLCDGGTIGGMDFTYKPDAIKGRYKRTDSNSENSHIIAYLWNGSYTSKIGATDNSKTQDATDADRVVFGKSTGTTSGNLVAKCDYEFSTTNSDWQTIVVPLEYADATLTPEKMNVVVCAGDYWTRSNLQENTCLLADDIDFVYYSTLSSLKVKGADVALTDGTYTYNVAGKMPTSVDDVVATCKSQFATAAVALDAANYQVKITVSNQGGKDTDGETSHTYTLQYTAPTVVSYAGLLNVDMLGMDLFCNTSKTVQISYYNDNTCDFVLPDFSFSGIALGDITVPDVKVTTDASGNKTFSDGNVADMSLGGGAIHAHVVLSNGTISSDGKINMPITVGWMANYEDSDYEETSINVAFTTEEKVYYAESGYDYAVKDSDYKNPQYEHEYGTFKSVKYGPDEDGEFTYTITLEQQQGNIIVSGLTKDDNDQYSGTDANATWAGETTSVTVSGGKNADGSYELKFTRTAEDGTQYDCVYTTNNVSSSVESLNGAAVAVAGTTGAIEVYNCNGRVAVYTVDGRKVADQTANGNTTIPAAAGIYIVRAADKTAKVIVK